MSGQLKKRIVRVRPPTDEERNFLSIFYQMETIVSYDAAPDEASEPTTLWCIEHNDLAEPQRDENAGGCWSRPVGSAESKPCRIVRAPIAVHLGVPVTP